MKQTTLHTFTPNFKLHGNVFQDNELNPLVDSLKRKYASIIDDLNEARKITEDGEAKRYLSTAITQAEISQMLAVKAVTWGDGIFLTTGEDLP